jgi:3-oxoadipate enol-lactonase
LIALASDRTIGYDDVGTGISLVLLHAFPHNRTMWAPQVSALVEHGRCIAPDVRGFGESTSASPFTIERYADDLADLLAILGVGPVVVCGLSMGGYIALAFYRRHTALVRALVLADTRATADTEETKSKRRELIGVARESGAVAVADSQITGMLGSSTRSLNPDLVESVHQSLREAPVEGIIGALEAMMARPDSTPMLASIAVPTLIVVGDEDVITPQKEARAMHSAIRGSRMEVIRGAGHLSNLERPAAFNHIMSEFIGALNYT